MTLNGVIRCNTCNKLSPKSGSKDGVCKMCLEIAELKKIISSNQLETEKLLFELKEKIKHLKHSNTTLRKSNKGLKAIVKRLKPYAPKQTFYDDGEAYRKELENCDSLI